MVLRVSSQITLHDTYEKQTFSCCREIEQCSKRQS